MLFGKEALLKRGSGDEILKRVGVFKGYCGGIFLGEALKRHLSEKWCFLISYALRKMY
ncbi:hypothetical protein MCW_01317 [Cardidatus Bartonella washoeensis 085-0475]|uniref:Uncharacterized protein n=1 Tax=Cardidatus Bartonella washoeensis 085-0475 TaxID=1094564 RepID=J1JHC0_9HYPH|nr:hypothetical protein MCW_01317 [Bartonella washoeensis 085-0475]